MAQNRQFDIAIIGGGMVGASLAAALPKTLSVALVESFSMPTEGLSDGSELRPSFDNRATALSKSSQHFFEKIGVWSALAPFCETIKDVHVSDKGFWGSVLLSEAQERISELGFVIENKALGHLIFSQLQTCNNIESFSPVKVSDIELITSGVRLTTLQTNNAGENIASSIRAKLVIVADGANSSMCKKLGIKIQRHDYAHNAIISNIATSQPHSNIAFERFTKTGPMALLPLLSTEKGLHRSALVWTLPKNQAAEMMDLSDEEFLIHLQQHFGGFQGEFTLCGKRFSYPLALTTAAEQVRQHVVVMGNAAHSLHPVAGQGFNLALRDVACLSELIASAIDSAEPWHKLDVLDQYEQAQQDDQWLTTLFSDGLPHVFSHQAKPIAAGRNMGLLALELLPSLKTQFVDFATGYR